MLNQLWELVNDRLNYLTPTIKPTGYATDRNGRRKSASTTTPCTPFDRLLDADVLSPAQIAGITAYRDSLNPAQIARDINPPRPTHRPARRATLDLEAALTPHYPTPPAASDAKPADDARHSGHGSAAPGPISRAFLPEAWRRFRGQLDVRHLGVRCCAQARAGRA